MCVDHDKIIHSIKKKLMGDGASAKHSFFLCENNFASTFLLPSVSHIRKVYKEKLEIFEI
jgi:hypothetical protein